MLNPILNNVKTPLAMTSGAFRFVFQTIPRPQKLDRDHAHIRYASTRV
jgi:hypothetical protein